MRAAFHTQFNKQLRKLTVPQKKQFEKRLTLFLDDPFHPILNNHALHSEYRKYRSINVSGDLRAMFEVIGSDIAHFIAIGTHSELYS